MSDKNIKEKPLLVLDHVKKLYENGFQAIFDLELSINKNEFIVFVGPSGCGKTTTIRMIAGLEKVTEGKIIMNDRNITDISSRKRNISMVFQNYALFPHLSVKENIIFTLKTKKVSKEIIEQKLNWAADVLKLKYVLNRKPAQLSGGQRQRVALGRAIVAEPSLFLMDEPLSNLDAKLRGTMRSVIRRLHNELGTTSIYVTHDQIEAMTMADRIVVMSDGHIQQVGKPEEVFLEPTNLFVASFIGVPAINLIDGEKINNNFVYDHNDKKAKVDIKHKPFKFKPTSKDLVMGVRPQYIEVVDKKTKGAIEYEVDYMEILGSEIIVFTKEKLEYISDITKKPKIGEKVYLKFDPKHIMIFDKKTEISLTSNTNALNKKYIKKFSDSEEEIKIRTNIMNKEKDKKADISIYEKIKLLYNDFMYPKQVLMNPEITKLLKEKKSIILSIKNAKRLKNKNDFTKLVQDKKNKQLEIKELTKKVREVVGPSKLFSKNLSRIEKIRTSFEIVNKDLRIEKQFKKDFLDLVELSEKISNDINFKYKWDQDEIVSFNERTQEILSLLKSSKSLIKNKKKNKK